MTFHHWLKWVNPQFWASRSHFLPSRPPTYSMLSTPDYLFSIFLIFSFGLFKIILTPPQFPIWLKIRVTITKRGEQNFDQIFAWLNQNPFRPERESASNMKSWALICLFMNCFSLVLIRFWPNPDVVVLSFSSSFSSHPVGKRPVVIRLWKIFLVVLFLMRANPQDPSAMRSLGQKVQRLVAFRY